MKPLTVKYSVANPDRLRELLMFLRGAQAADGNAVDFTYTTDPACGATIFVSSEKVYCGLAVYFGAPYSVEGQ